MRTLSVMAIFFGLLLIGVFFPRHMIPGTFEHRAAEVVGKIVAVEKVGVRKGSKGSRGYTIWKLDITFETLGGRKQKFQEQVDHLLSVSVGDPIPVNYDPRKPALARIKKTVNPMAQNLMLVIGAVLLVFGVTRYRKDRSERLALAVLKRQGVRMMAEVVEMERASKTVLNRRLIHVYVKAKAVHPNSGRELHFISTNFFVNHQHDLIGQQVPVYVDRMDASKYSVDVDALRLGLPHVSRERMSLRDRV